MADINAASAIISENTRANHNNDSGTVVTNATISSKSQQKKTKRKNRKNTKSQHTLDHMRQRVSELMHVFDEKGWFLPLPETTTNDKKVWSNRNYGADKKRQRKNQERLLLEARIIQLEAVLREKYSYNLDTRLGDLSEGKEEEEEKE